MGLPQLRPQPGKSVRRRPWRLAGYVALALILLVVAAAGSGYAYLRRSLPQATGTLAVPGLQAPVTIYRDAWGVPHIFAANRHDLYFAQGFAIAQDRLFQMDVLRRAAAGRLSEVFGASQLDTDRFMRSLMLRRSAEASVAVYTETDRAAIQAYADGVNACISQGRLPPEFLLLGYKPEPWTPADSASVGKYMAYNQGGNWSAEVWRYQLVERVGAARAAELLPDYPTDAPMIMQYLKTADADLERLVALAPVPDAAVGSNSWVVAGSRTASGKPLLANDPHLEIREPAFWHAVHLNLAAEGLDVAGLTLPGAPGVVVGHNQHVAWGLTNMNVDAQDLYVEVPNPQNPQEFLYNGHYEPARVLNEDIKVRGRDQPVPFTVLVTRHGPIITPVAGGSTDRPAAALAMRWTANQPSTELSAILAVDRAKNWPQFREALRAFQAPTMNWTFAADDGTIAYRGQALIPIRKHGNGTLPVPGWTDEYEWKGFIPFDELPEVVNPREGFIVTANARVVDDSYPYFLSAAWAPRYRHERIRTVLTDAQGWTVQEMERLQNDHANLQAKRLLPVLLPAAQAGLKDADPLERQAMQALQSWNGFDDAEAVAPAIYHAWYRNLQRELYAPIMGDALLGRMTDAIQITDRLLLAAGQGKPSAWLPQDGLPGVAARSLRRSVAELQGRLGGNLKKWQWQKLHTITYAHPMGSVKPLNLLLNVGPFALGGGNVTVEAASYPRLGPGFEVTNAAPGRLVADLANLTGNSFSVVTPGESGNPLSRHYGDAAKLWLQGGYHPDLMQQEQLQGAHRQDWTPGP